MNSDDNLPTADEIEESAADEAGGVSWNDAVLIAFVAGMLLLNVTGLFTQIFGVDSALIVAFVGGYGIFWDSLERLLRGKLGGDLAVTIAAFAAVAIGQYAAAAEVVLIMLIGTALESFAVGKTRGAIAALLRLTPATATLLREGHEVTVPIAQIERGDHILIRPGERIPADGVVGRGESAIDQAALTGESLPVTKQAGDRVYTGTINTLGLLEVEVEAVGSETTLAQIIRLVEEAEARKAPVERLADRWAGYFVPTVVALGALTFACWYLLLGATLEVALTRMASTLIIACPCALILATPTAIAAAAGRCARRGILMRGGAHLEAMAQVNCVVFDKTGTLTLGQPAVVDIISLDGHSREDVLRVAAVAERGTAHPIGAAVLDAYDNALHSSDGHLTPSANGSAAPAPMAVTAHANGHSQVTPHDSANGNSASRAGKNYEGAQRSEEPLESAEIRPGLGVVARQAGRQLLVGNRQLLTEHGVSLPPELEQASQALETRGQTAVLVAESAVVLGLIAIEDRPRPEAACVVAGLKALGIERVVMLTGDAAPAAAAVAQAVGITEFHASLFPADKVAHLRALQAEGCRVAMVGDGINDAPCLAAADVGIAMGHGGADIAVEAAAIVFVADDLTRLPETIVISRRALRTVRRSILWFALGLNGLSVLLSASGLLAWLGYQLQAAWPVVFGSSGRDLSPVLAAVEHQIASLLVVTSSLRLLGGRVAWKPGDVAEPMHEGNAAALSANVTRWFIQSPARHKVQGGAAHMALVVRRHRQTMQRAAGVAIVLCWLLSGLYTVPAGQVGVVQRFGHLAQADINPGLHYRMPWPVERVTVVDVSGVRRAEIGFRSTRPGPAAWLPLSDAGNTTAADNAPAEWSTVHGGNMQRVAEESILLTGDEYLVDANLTLQYRVSDPARFLFQINDAETTLREAGEAALRRAAEHTPLEDLLTTGRADLEASIQRQAQGACDRYQTGLTVLTARLQDVHPPQDVVAAYRDVSSAAEQKATVINQAEAYRNETGPLAHGQAAQNIALANAFTFDRVHRALGDANHFAQLVDGYHSGPQVNSDRIYLETVEQALTGPHKFIMDPAGGGRRQMWLADGQLSGLPGLPAPEPRPRQIPPGDEGRPEPER